MVTVPLCPLYNPGNPRHCVVARGNGAGQSAAAGTTKHTAAAAAEVKVTMGLQAGSIALLGSHNHHQPTDRDTQHIPWSLATASWASAAI